MNGALHIKGVAEKYSSKTVQINGKWEILIKRCSSFAIHVYYYYNLYRIPLLLSVILIIIHVNYFYNLYSILVLVTTKCNT